jgi:curli production assembly/transport component CsgE
MSQALLPEWPGTFARALALLALPGFGWLAAPVAAQDANVLAPEHKPADLNRPIQSDAYDGVVVNETVTLLGNDFYRAFVAAWRDKPLSERYAITIGERPSVRWGTQVWVEFNRRRVYQSFLPPARARVAGIAEQAAEVAYQNVVQSEAQRLLFRDPDLGPDEL